MSSATVTRPTTDRTETSKTLERGIARSADSDTWLPAPIHAWGFVLGVVIAAVCGSVPLLLLL